MTYIPTETGQWVSENYERLARVVNDYDPALELRWIPPERRTVDDKNPYLIFDTRMNQPVFYASELDTPEQILTRLFKGDTTKNNPLKEIEAYDAAQKVMNMKKQMDMHEEAMEEAEFLVKSPLNTLRFKGKKFDHKRRVIE